MIKPTVFIGSSTEGIEFCRAARTHLKDVAEVTVWNEDFFHLGKTFIESLVDSLPRFDFAVLVLTPDDLVISRDVESFGPRDNVVFELGLFMGQLGRLRTFLMHQMGVKIPSDLSGVTMAAYEWPRTDNSYIASVGSACDSIRKVIRDLGSSERKINKELGDIRNRQTEQQLQIEALGFVVRTYIQGTELGHLLKLRRDEPFLFKNKSSFQAELRRLRALGVIKAKPGATVGNLPEKGDLKDFFTITEVGLSYLEYRERFDDLLLNLRDAD